MLVPTRRCGQKLCISDSITVCVVSIGRGRVQIGIEAPANISVRRVSNPQADNDVSDSGHATHIDSQSAM